MPEPAPAPPISTFTPVPTRPRHDGWTAKRQKRFVEALAESGCVEDAAAHVGMSVSSAYRLRRRFDASAFRVAWDAALDYAIRRLSDAAYSRAIKGVAVPHYYKGEVVGEHRKYDESLTRFLLRYRDPLRYGKFYDKTEFAGSQEILAVRLARMLRDVETGTAGIYKYLEQEARAERARKLEDEAENDEAPMDGA